MRKKVRKLTKHHQQEVEKLEWVASTLARQELNKKHLGNATDYEDLKQVAMWGVSAAVYDWKSDGGKSISSYAWDRANAYIGHYMRDKSRIIKVPRKIQKLYYSWCELKKTNPNLNSRQILKILECTELELQEAIKVSVSTPYQLYADTLNPEIETEYRSENYSEKARHALDIVATYVTDKEMQMCLKYFSGLLKKPSDVRYVEEIISAIKDKMEANGITLDDLNE